MILLALPFATGYKEFSLLNHMAVYAKFFANQTYIKLAFTTIGHTAILMAVTGVLGYCIAYFLTMKVRSPLWRTALFLAFIILFWTSTLIRAIAWVPFLGVNATCFIIGWLAFQTRDFKS